MYRFNFNFFETQISFNLINLFNYFLFMVVNAYITCVVYSFLNGNQDEVYNNYKNFSLEIQDFYLQNEIQFGNQDLINLLQVLTKRDLLCSKLDKICNPICPNEEISFCETLVFLNSNGLFTNTNRNFFKNNNLYFSFELFENLKDKLFQLNLSTNSNNTTFSSEEWYIILNEPDFKNEFYYFCLKIVFIFLKEFEEKINFY